MLSNIFRFRLDDERDKEVTLSNIAVSGLRAQRKLFWTKDLALGNSCTEALKCCGMKHTFYIQTALRPSYGSI